MNLVQQEANTDCQCNTDPPAGPGAMQGDTAQASEEAEIYGAQSALDPKPGTR